MNKKESRRIVPISVVMIVVFAALVVFELLVIGGALEVRSSVVAKVAPWAYEPFLKLVGEHPDSEMLRNHLEKRSEGKSHTDSAAATLGGFNPEALSLGIDTNAVGLGDLNAETNSSTNGQSQEVPVDNPSNTPPVNPKAVVPVG